MLTQQFKRTPFDFELIESVFHPRGHLGKRTYNTWDREPNTQNLPTRRSITEFLRAKQIEIHQRNPGVLRHRETAIVILRSFASFSYFLPAYPLIFSLPHLSFPLRILLILMTYLLSLRRGPPQHPLRIYINILPLIWSVGLVLVAKIDLT